MQKLEKTCKIHGVLEEKDIKKHKEGKRCKKEYSLRCQKCVDEKTWKDAVICKVHGKLKLEDLISRGRCRKCHSASANVKRNNNRELFNAKMAEKRAENPEKWEEIYKKAYEIKVEKYGKREINTKEIIRMYGLTRDQYDKMFEDQKSLCDICCKPETRKNRSGDVARLTVDHCHETNNVRALLCHSCNTGLGKFEDDVDRLFRAIAYLEHHK